MDGYQRVLDAVLEGGMKEKEKRKTHRSKIAPAARKAGGQFMLPVLDWGQFSWPEQPQLQQRATPKRPTRLPRRGRVWASGP